MSISSEEEKKKVNENKLMQSVINAQALQISQTEKIHNYLQQPQLLQDFNIMMPSQIKQEIKFQASPQYNTPFFKKHTEFTNKNRFYYNIWHLYVAKML